MSEIRGYLFMMGVTCLGLLGFGSVSSCDQGREKAMSDLLTQIEQLQRDKSTLNRDMEIRDAQITALENQIANLSSSVEQPLRYVFPIDRIDILGISGGANLDEKPGDDAVTVYFRPLDREGDVLKRGGRIEVELLDLTRPGTPLSLGSTTFDSPESVQKAWYGKFWTDYYKVVIPLPLDTGLLPGQEVDIKVRFTDVMTGREFTARKTVTINRIRE